MTKRFRVVESYGWFYVRDDDGQPPFEDAAPWRYKWEAQERADELNGTADGEEGDKK